MPPYLFDRFTIVHFCIWFVFGVLGVLLIKRPWLALTLAIVLGLSWEVIELLIVEPICGWHEYWYNRWITDILADGIGAYIGILVAKKR